MPINNGMNYDYVSYFPLEEYVSRIKLLPKTLEHLEATNKDFDDYMKKLATYDEEYIINYWIYLLYQELYSSKRIESLGFDEKSMVESDVLFDTLNINHKRIHTLHNFVTQDEMEPTFEYRKKEVNVSRINKDGSEDIFWRGSNACDVNRFMNDYIKIYKHSGTSLLYSNPFLSSALMQLLFLRIHPYIDGNGRTSRIIHNIKFTESINKLYGTKLKLSPLNLSQSIYINKISYVKALDNIYFDLENDTNAAINNWFDFILNMADEQLNVSNQKIDEMDLFDSMPKKNKFDSKNMKLSKIR